MLCRLNPSHKVRKKGRFPRATGRKRFIQRYFCRECSRSFSIKTTSLFRNERKSHVNQRVLRLVNIGVSQRQIAIELNIHRSTVAKKARKLAQLARIKNERKRPDYFLETTGIVFDEMETFEHTQCVRFKWGQLHTIVCTKSHRRYVPRSSKAAKQKNLVYDQATRTSARPSGFVHVVSQRND